MPSGACVIRYEGARGVVWRIKYLDAEGRQVKETVGREADGWTRQKAERALGAKLDAVARGHAEAEAPHVRRSHRRVRAVALPAKPRKKSTLVDYRATIRHHLRPALGHSTSRSCRGHRRSSSGTRATRSLPACRRRRSATTSSSPDSCSRRLGGGGGCRRTRSSSSSPRRCPTTKRRRSTAAEIAAVLKAYSVLEAAADDAEKPWYAAARRMTTRGALDRPASRRAARVAVAGRRTARTADPRSAAVRPKRDHHAEEPGGPPDAPARRRGGEGARGAVRRRRGIGRPSRSCSAIRRSGRRSTRRS